MKNIKHIKDLAKLDICREKRSGIPEVILASGKEPKSVAKLLISMAKEKGKAIATRIDKSCLAKIRKLLPPGYKLRHYAKARMVVLIKRGHKDKEIGGKVGIIDAPAFLSFRENVERKDKCDYCCGWNGRSITNSGKRFGGCPGHRCAYIDWLRIRRKRRVSSYDYAAILFSRTGCR